MEGMCFDHIKIFGYKCCLCCRNWIFSKCWCVKNGTWLLITMVISAILFFVSLQTEVSDWSVRWLHNMVLCCCLVLVCTSHNSFYIFCCAESATALHMLCVSEDVTWTAAEFMALDSVENSWKSSSCNSWWSVSLFVFRGAMCQCHSLSKS